METDITIYDDSDWTLTKVTTMNKSKVLEFLDEYQQRLIIEYLETIFENIPSMDERKKLEYARRTR